MRCYSLCLAALFITTLSFAQETAETSTRKTLYGITLGWNKTNLRLNNQWQNGAQVASQDGFHLGIVADRKLSKLFSVSPKLAISFHDSKVLLTEIAAPNVVEIMPVVIDLQAHFNIHSNWGKHNPYFILGPRYSIPLAQEDSDFLNFDSARDLGIDAGLGIEFIKEGIHICPELRYSVSGTSAVLNSLVPAVYRETIAFAIVLKG